MIVVIRSQFIESIKELGPPLVLYGVMRLAERVVRVYPDFKVHAKAFIHMWAVTEWVQQINSEKPRSLCMIIGTLFRAYVFRVSYDFLLEKN